MHRFPPRRSSDLTVESLNPPAVAALDGGSAVYPANSKLAFTENVKFGYLPAPTLSALSDGTIVRSEEHTSELQSRGHLVCRLLLEKKNTHRAVGIPVLQNGRRIHPRAGSVPYLADEAVVGTEETHGPLWRIRCMSV